MTESVVPEDWLRCPACGGDVEAALNPHSEYRNYVKCTDCGAGGYFENATGLPDLFAEVGV